jgi:hypothetical protein
VAVVLASFVVDSYRTESESGDFGLSFGDFAFASFLVGLASYLNTFLKICKKFCFNTQYAFPESGKRFSLRKCQIRIPHMFYRQRGHFEKKIFKDFFTWVVPYCIVAPKRESSYLG